MSARLVKIATLGACLAGLGAIRDHAVVAGLLDVVLFDHVSNRIVLTAQPRLSLAA